MAQFMLLLHDRLDGFADLSHDQMMDIIKEYTAWTEKMIAEGRFLGGEKLKDEPGRNLTTGAGGVEVHAGPFTEPNEMIGGYMTIEAADYDEAVEIAKTCPHVKYGRIELREIDQI
ncbi:YciI family protein [Kordiimonas gwangyangensis]|uniref:YciI family protein n=1 Tax=Kordiimonas gwangyangensis TaxID=288022 RepID=UPI000367A0B0|nr:YciI family protein [Kordiimonas gwangyangensis]